MMRKLNIVAFILLVCSLPRCSQNTQVDNAEREEEIVKAVNESSKTVIHSESPEEVICAYGKLQDLLAEAENMTPPHPRLRWIKAKVEILEQNMHEAEKTLFERKIQQERIKREREALEQRRKQERAEREKRRREELLRKHKEEQERKQREREQREKEIKELERQERLKNTRFETGDRIARGVRGGLIYGVTVTCFYCDDRSDGINVSITLIVRNKSRQPVNFFPDTVKLVDDDGAEYLPEEAYIILVEEMDYELCIVERFNPHETAMFQIYYRVPKRNYFLLPIPDFGDYAYVIDGEDRK